MPVLDAVTLKKKISFVNCTYMMYYSLCVVIIVFLLIIKRDYIIDKQLPRWIMKYSKCPLYLIPFYTTLIIHPFLISRISDNHEIVDGLSAHMIKFLYRGLLLYWNNSSFLINYFSLVNEGWRFWPILFNQRWLLS